MQKRLITAVAVLGYLAFVDAARAETSARVGDDKAEIDEQGRPSIFGVQVERGWNTPYALLFQLTNVLQNPDFLRGYDGMGFGARYHLTHATALRLGVNLFHDHNPAINVETIDVQAGEKVVTVQKTGQNPLNGTRQFDGRVVADYLMRFTQKALTPYAGVGLSLGYNLRKTQFRDDKSTVDHVAETNNKTTTATLGARGVFGVEWMIHDVFSIFAEYALTMDFIDHVRRRDDTRVEDTSGGDPAVRQTQVQSDKKSFFGTALGLNQGASFGLAVHFSGP